MALRTMQRARESGRLTGEQCAQLAEAIDGAAEAGQ
jgi:hypothetical protein